MVPLTPDQEWRKGEAAYDTYLIELRAWMKTTKKIERKDALALLDSLTSYRERYLALVDADV